MSRFITFYHNLSRLITVAVLANRFTDYGGADWSETKVVVVVVGGGGVEGRENSDLHN